MSLADALDKMIDNLAIDGNKSEIRSQVRNAAVKVDNVVKTLTEDVEPPQGPADESR